MAAGSSWVRVLRPCPDARVRLFCLPFAGGGAKLFRSWPAALPVGVEVCALQLPGRENRLREPAIEDMDTMVERALEALETFLDRRLAFFGHSLGALIAFELARHLQVLGLQAAHFFPSGCGAPHLHARHLRRHTLTDSQFLAEVQQLQGMPKELLADDAFMRLLLPTLRSDFKLAETYEYRPLPPLRCPVTVFGGLQDNELCRHDMEGWSVHSSGPFRLHMLPGDHFFLNSSASRLLQLIGADLTRAGGG